MDLGRGFGGIALEEAQKLRRDVLFRVGSATSHDKAVWLCHACGPVFTRRWAALREAVKLSSETRAWQETVPLNVACRRWPAVLGFAVEVLRELDWQTEDGGREITRRDSRGQLRRFPLWR